MPCLLERLHGADDHDGLSHRRLDDHVVARHGGLPDTTLNPASYIDACLVCSGGSVLLDESSVVWVKNAQLIAIDDADTEPAALEFRRQLQDGARLASAWLTPNDDQSRICCADRTLEQRASNEVEVDPVRGSVIEQASHCGSPEAPIVGASPSSTCPEYRSMRCRMACTECLSCGSKASRMS